MWSLGGLFGGSAVKKADEPKNAIVALQESLTMTEKRQAHYAKLAEEQEAIAKKNVQNKRGMPLRATYLEFT